MKELTGLELRKALIKALGWTLFNYEMGMDATSDEDIAAALNNDGYTLEGWGESLEAWQFQPEYDATISERTLVKECTQRGWLWDLYTTPQKQVSCSIYRHDHNGVLAHEYGATPSEARARALLAALTAPTPRSEKGGERWRTYRN